MAELSSSWTPSGRLVSLDALRGFDMFWIIGGSEMVTCAVKASEVQLPIDIPAQFQHVPWDGFHFIDLIFPLFLFIIGVAIPLSFEKRLARGENRLKILRHVLVRVLILIVLGWMVNGNLLTYDPSKFELSYSVLQMLALGYLVASILYLSFRLPGQIAATVLMLLGYWALLAFVPGPGHQIGQFREGCNLGDWITEALVGKWRGRQVGWVLGILGHAGTAMLGVFAGHILRSPQSISKKCLRLTGQGVLCLLLGVFWSGWIAQLCPGFHIFGSSWTDWPIWFPIIKNRWTSSFALYAGGWSYLLLAGFYLVIDGWQVRRWAFPFVVIGANSIFAYMAWQLCRSAFRSVSNTFLGGLKIWIAPWHETLLAAGATLALWLLLYEFYRHKTFIRV